MRRLTLPALLLLLFFLLLWSGAPSSSRTGQTGHTGDTGGTVLLIGDSIAQSIADEARVDLEAEGRTVVVQGVGGTGLTHGSPAWQLGATFDWQQRLAELDATYDPDVVIIVLGTNDVFAVPGGEDYARHVSRLLSATDAPTVFWADIASHTADEWRNAGARAINTAIATHEREGYSVVPFDAMVSTVVENLDRDGLHLSAAGQSAFSSLVATMTAPE
jgi:lysophospholipase L1-like esterase